MTADLKSLRSEYSSAMSGFKKTEADLAKSLDALMAARDVDLPDSITRTRVAAKEANKVASAAWDTVEQARRAYWSKQAELAEAKLAAVALPLLAELATVRRFACLPVIPPELMLRHHLLTAPVAVAGLEHDVSGEPVDSPALNRAGDEI